MTKCKYFSQSPSDFFTSGILMMTMMMEFENSHYVSFRTLQRVIRLWIILLAYSTFAYFDVQVLTRFSCPCTCLCLCLFIVHVHVYVPFCVPVPVHVQVNFYFLRQLQVEQKSSCNWYIAKRDFLMHLLFIFYKAEQFYQSTRWQLNKI